jgi:DNA-binding phage protein
MPGFSYKSYNFVEKDPMIDYIRTIVVESGTPISEIEERSGVTSHTLYNWFYGKTKRPQAASINAVLRALGYKLAITPINFPEEIRATPYQAPPARREHAPRNIMARLENKTRKLANKDKSWATIVGRPNSTNPPGPSTQVEQGKVVPRSVPFIPPISSKK